MAANHLRRGKRAGDEVGCGGNMSRKVGDAQEAEDLEVELKHVLHEWWRFDLRRGSAH